MQSSFPDRDAIKKNPKNLDYVPTLNLGYTKKEDGRPERTSNTSRKTDYSVEKRSFKRKAGL